MKVFPNMSIRFRLRKAGKSLDKSSYHVVYCRIILNGSRSDFSTNQKVLIKNWDPVQERVKDNHTQYQNINRFLETTSQQIIDTYLSFRASNIELTLNDIKKAVFLKGEIVEEEEDTDHKLMKIVTKYQLALRNKSKVKLMSHSTVKGYIASLNVFRRYFKNVLKNEDIDVKHIPKDMFFKFENYLMLKQNRSANYTHKVIKHIRIMLNFAYFNNWIENRVEVRYNIKYSNPVREIISMDELKSIMNYRSTSKKLEEVADVFIFQCLTGIAYSDVHALTVNNLKVINNRTWVFSNRKKTGNEQKLILLKEAIAVLEKYKNHPHCIKKNVLLPVLPNPEYNKELKVIQAELGINTKLTTHVARHVFATVVALGNGLAIETLQKAHSSIKTTQIYGKIIDDKIAYDFDKLNDKFSEQFSSDTNDA